MSFESLVWQQASLAESGEAFLRQMGTAVLKQLATATLIVRKFSEHDFVPNTLYGMRRRGVHLEFSQQNLLVSAAASERVRTWIGSGASVWHFPPRSAFVPDVLGELHRLLGERAWGFLPLEFDQTPLGVLGFEMRVSRAQTKAPQDARVLAEALAVVLSREKERTELSRQRHAAEIEKDAALARLQVKDIQASIVGAEMGLFEVMQQVNQVASTSTPVLIRGETGSGKEVVARAIHERSTRSTGPIVRVNCGAIAPDLLDSELFGHERGSFTGALSQRQGWFERADGGTLFLDEIGELSLAAQVRLLRVLQDGTFERVGAHKPLHVNVRVIAATHRDLQEMIRERLFREDLWYRISTFVISLPPLRERLQDIEALAQYFADRSGRRYGAGPLRLTGRDVEALKRYAWPGNVRELGAVIERAAILGEGKFLKVAEAIGSSTTATPIPSPSTDLVAAPATRPITLEDAMRAHIEGALQESRGQVEGKAGAARRLGVNPHTLRSKMRKLHIDWIRFRDPGY